MPLTSDTVEELNKLINVFFKKVGRKERLSKQILKLMDECEVYLYPKIRDWMQLSRKQIIRDIKNRILKIEKKSNPQIVIDYVDWETIEEEGKSIIKPAYLNIMERSGNLSRAQARIEASFDVINPLSVKWAEKYSSELVTLVGKETKAGLREMVSHGLDKGKTFKQIAKEIETIGGGIGLNERQTKTLLKYGDFLDAQGLKGRAYLDKYNKYYDRLQRERSELIARTEANRSVNEGYLDSLEGTRYEEVELSSAADACTLCLDLAGQRFKRSEASGRLPVHPACRCHWIVVIPGAKKPKVPKKPEKPSDNLVSKYKDKIEEQRKLTNEIALYRKKLGNAYYREKNMVDAKKYGDLMKEASAKRRYSINQMKMGIRKDLYVDKALRPEFRPEMLFPDIGTEQKSKILKAINECEKFIHKGVVGRYEVAVRIADGRAFYYRGDVYLGKWDPYHTANTVNKNVIHELGHFIEDQSGGVHRSVMEFYSKRTKGCPLEWLGSGYRTDELTRKDKFIDAYMGKDYKGQASEILSMGLQYFYDDPYKLAIKDPEYFNFIYKIVRGAL